LGKVPLELQSRTTVAGDRWRELIEAAEDDRVWGTGCGSILKGRIDDSTLVDDRNFCNDRTVSNKQEFFVVT
jgi:hypothetical protein